MDYKGLNLEPLYDLLKTKTQTWSRLPLGIMRCINLVEMILLPKLLYLFIGIPEHIFKSMESILNTFIWGPSQHKLSWASSEVPCPPGWHCFTRPSPVCF